MMRIRKFIRDNGDETQVDFSYRILDSEQLEISDLACWLWADRNEPTVPNVQLTDAEYQRFENEVIEDPDTWEYDYDYD